MAPALSRISNLITQTHKSAPGKQARGGFFFPACHPPKAAKGLSPVIPQRGYGDMKVVNEMKKERI